MAENLDTVKRLSRISDAVMGKVVKPKNAAVGVVGEFEVYVSLEGLIDFEKEKARLRKEEEKIAGEIKAISGRLKDKNFISKAPAEVIDKQRMRKEELGAQMEKIKDNLKSI